MFNQNDIVFNTKEIKNYVHNVIIKEGTIGTVKRKIFYSEEPHYWVNFLGSSYWTKIHEKDILNSN